MKNAYLAIWALLLVAISAGCGETDQKQLDEGFLRNYMAGEYELIGRKTDSVIAMNAKVAFDFTSRFSMLSGR